MAEIIRPTSPSPGASRIRPSLVDFLHARLDEDEAVARTCAEMFPSPWDIADRGWRVRIYASDVPIPDLMADDEDAMTTRSPVVMEVEPGRHIEDPRWLSERVAHIARHDPARVLADVEAKRRIVEWATDGDHSRDLPFDERYVLATLALPYADHPDYDEEWKP